MYNTKILGAFSEKKNITLCVELRKTLACMWQYNPHPTHVWYRVQNSCTYVSDTPASPVYVPLTGETVSLAEYNAQRAMIQKGNLLQHIKNRIPMSKNQKYAQIARGGGPCRTKVYATQTQQYTNPNTRNLARANFTTYPYPNNIVGAPNNPAGPFMTGTPNPNACEGNGMDAPIRDGGTLVCGTSSRDPCALAEDTASTAAAAATNPILCFPAAASNVPGPSVLCWDNRVTPWTVRTQYTMNNSTNKWPQNYKAFVRAVPDSSLSACYFK